MLAGLLRSAQPSSVESWNSSVSRTKSICHLLSVPGQVWLLISPKVKVLKERHESFSVILESDVRGQKQECDSLDATSFHHVGRFALESSQ